MGRCLVLLLALLSGCANVGPYRISATPCELPPPQIVEGLQVWESSADKCASSRAVRSNGKYRHRVNYVEFDEQGILTDREAMEDALQSAAQPVANDKQRAYVLVFIHGWHHNAHPDDANVQSFHTALSALAKWREKDDVRGIYIGWRGDSLQIPGLRYLTFWDRKSTSEEVGRGGLLEFLLRLETTVKQRGANTRLVLVGHSFGASVAFNALAHVYLERFMSGVHSSANGPRFRGYGDLTVLVNPAIEAMRYMPFQSALQYYTRRTEAPRADFRHETVPRLVILSSEGDWATRKTFPGARFFSTLLEVHHKVSPDRSPDDSGQYGEWRMDQETVGNYELFHSHWPLRLAKDLGGQTPSPQQEQLPVRDGMVPDPVEHCRLLDRKEVLRLLSAESPADVETGEFFQDSRLRVLRKPSTPSRAPYVVAAVDRQIIKSHSDIGSKNLMCWINQLVDAE